MPLRKYGTPVLKKILANITADKVLKTTLGEIEYHESGETDIQCRTRLNELTGFKLVYDTYYKVATKEISYYGNDIAVEGEPKDTYMSVDCIASRDTLFPEDIYDIYRKCKIYADIFM